jgi:hypothetical protein
MKTLILPEKESWEKLCERPGISKDDLENVVRDIL